MCLGGGAKVDRTMQYMQMQEAEEARQKEAERVARIEQGTGQINDLFAGFDDAYYDNRQANFLNYYQPQLDDQFGDAKDQVTFAFARNGTLNSSAAGDKQADLLKQYDVEKAGLLSQAMADRSQAQAKTNQEKSALISQLNATSNAEQVGNQATARTQQLMGETPQYSSLGDVFGGIANSIGQYNKGYNTGQTVGGYFGTNSPRSSAATTYG